MLKVPCHIATTSASLKSRHVPLWCELATISVAYLSRKMRFGMCDASQIHKVLITLRIYRIYWTNKLTLQNVNKVIIKEHR